MPALQGCAASSRHPGRATLITLVLVPCLYVIIDDIRKLLLPGASEE